MTYDELRLRSIGAMDQLKAAQDAEGDALRLLHQARGTREAAGLEASYTSARQRTIDCRLAFAAAYDAMEVVR